MAARMSQQKAGAVGLGTSLPVHRFGVKSTRPQTSLNGVPKKLNTLDSAWKKTFLGTGLFVEDAEKSEVNILERMEKKKVLSSVEESGLLTLLEKTGLSLTTVEELGLLSKAEKLGVLSITESLLTADPGKVVALSIPLFVLSIGALVALPGGEFLGDLLRFGAFGVFFTGASALFVAGFVSSSLQED
eukprot:evm.model.scf_2885.3 EVM.evm.TU.scf_2885.3   scf_2885:12614-16330(-)